MTTVYDVIFHNVDEGILLIDGSGQITAANPVAHQLLRGLSGQLIGTFWNDRLSELLELRPTTGNFPDVERTASTGDDGLPGIDPTSNARRHRIKVYAPEGGRSVLEFQILALEKGGNAADEQIVILRDITDRIQNERALEGLSASIDRQVVEKTGELTRTIQLLEEEIQNRTRVEIDLRRVQGMLVQRLAEMNSKLTALYDLILLSSHPMDVQELMTRSLEIICTALNASAASIHSVANDDAPDKLLVELNLPASMDLFRMVTFRDWMEEDAIPWACEDLQNDPRVPQALRNSDFGAAMTKWVHLPGKQNGILSLFWVTPRVFDIQGIALFGAMADQLEFVLENARLREQREQNVALEERRRLARDLHDSVTQSLHSLALAADTALIRLQRGRMDKLEWSLNHLAESARQAVKEMRLLLFELSLEPVHDIDMVETLRLRLDSVEKRAGIDAHLEIVGDMKRIPPAWEQELYSIAMEALNNSLKHSMSSRVDVRLETTPHSLELIIQDNGLGFDVNSKFDKVPKHGGIGLLSMMERAVKLGGRLSIDSQAGAGTRVHLSVSLL